MMNRRVTYAEWSAEARALFGDDAMAWRFVCPSCKHVWSVRDWKEVGANESAVAFSCVGRWKGGGDAFIDRHDDPLGCNYAGGGLFAINPVTVVGNMLGNDGENHLFDFDRGEAP